MATSVCSPRWWYLKTVGFSVCVTNWHNVPLINCAVLSVRGLPTDLDADVTYSSEIQRKVCVYTCISSASLICHGLATISRAKVLLLYFEKVKIELSISWASDDLSWVSFQGDCTVSR